MSKQESKQTKRNLLRRGLAGILSLALILGLLPSGVFTAHAASWADPYCQTLVDWGVMRGDISGNLAPDRSITRAEFVTMMNRAYGYTKLGGHPFTDVRVTDWYSDDVDIGYNIGYFKGTSPTTASPNDTLTREQAAVLLARNMMLQPTVGETLGFSDSRQLSEWSRGLVGAAAASGIISGYNDGSFQPFKNITRGEVAAMLVRAIGTPINTPGEHALGNVYGNVTVNTSGVKLRDGVIVGNLYLTGGIDKGEVLLENVTVLGEIIVSGGGESNSSQSSVILRNVAADNMIVDSIGEQFVTIRAEGNTDIPTTTVRTNAYVDDSSLPGYGLSYITLDGEDGALYQLAGNIKDVVNKTPGSDLQVVQGSANKVTVDEYATGSKVLVDGDARVDDLNLDTAVTVTGTGDIKNLNVGAAGSTVEQLPDDITIRPGITTDIAGSNMNSTQAAESSADPKLLAGYPAVKNIAPNSATLVFRVNKPGTIYWAVSAVADGSVKEADLLEPPTYGGNVLKSGTIRATAANTDYTAAVTGLTRDGSYYVTAMLVDGRDEHSPIKVTSFSTPDDTVPAFNRGYPVMTRITTENAQVTVSTNKSCQLYYALLPAGSTAPTPAEFKANAISGNLGYGIIDAVKNVTQPFQVNSTRLKELTDYTLYLWLTDYDGAKSSRVYSLNFKTPDEQPPVIVSTEQTNATANTVEVTFTLNEAGTLYWAVVPEGQDHEVRFESLEDENAWAPLEVADPDDRRVQIKIENGAGNAISSGNARVNAGYTNGKARVTGLDPTQYGHSFTMYLVAKDAAGNYSKIQKIHIKTRDTDPPTVTQEFTRVNENNTDQPLVDTDIRLVFSEQVRGSSGADDFLALYRKVTEARDPAAEAEAKDALGKALHKYIRLYHGVTGDSTVNDRNEVDYVAECEYKDGQFQYGARVNGTLVPTDDWIINYCNATVELDRDGKMVVTFPTKQNNDGTVNKTNSALALASGATYHFVVENVVDTGEEANPLEPDPTRLKEFTTMFAKVLLTPGDELTLAGVTSDPAANNDPARIDYHFIAEPQGVEQISDGNMRWDMLIWADTSMKITLYSRPTTGGNWTKMGTLDIPADQAEGFTYRSVGKWIEGKANPTPNFEPLNKMTPREYAIHIDELESDPDFTAWNRTVSIRASIVAGTQSVLSNQVINGSTQTDYNAALGLGVVSVGTPDPFTMTKLFTDSQAPEINGRPSIDIHDTGAEIGMTLDRPGQVYYLIIPLSNLSANGTTLNSTLELEESDLKKVNSYNPAMDVKKGGDIPKPLGDVPLMNGDPDLDTSVSAGFTVDMPIRDSFINNRTFPNVIKGTTSSVPAHTRAVINLNGQLESNKVYLVCLLTRGVSAVYNEKVYCYRFTTNMPERPGLQLQGTNATAVDAIVDRTAQVRSVLLIKSGVQQNFPLLNEKLSAHLKSGLTLPDDAEDYTILDALFYDDGGVGGTSIKPSLFDTYADDNAKQQVRQRIQTTSAGAFVKAYWGTQTISVTGNATVGRSSMTFSGDLQAGVEYICLAYAMGSSAESASYRATYPLEIKDDAPPALTGLAQSLYLDDNNKIQGTITLTFDKYLYNSQHIPFAQSPSAGAVGDDYVGFGGAIPDIVNTSVKIVDAKTYSRTMSIQLKVEGMTNMPTFSFTVQNLFSSWGSPIQPYTVVFTREAFDDPFTGKPGVIFHYVAKQGNTIILQG